MESAEPLRLLSLDGGGVRGIASLYILKELMDQVRRNIHHSQSTRSGKVGIKPCEYFDLICGTSTGGLIAIMLGRLRYTVDQAITQYRTLAETAFATSSPDGGAGFDSKVLELAIKRLIAQAPAPKAGCLDEDEPYEDLSIDTSGGGCRTFVVATRTRGGHQAVRLRSYATRYNDALNGRIWEAARATSATATFFSPISIGPVLYGDGQTGWNNPAREIFDEAYWIWRGRPVGCLISLGTGEDPIQLPQVQGMTRSSFLGSVTSWFLSPKPSPEEVFRVSVAKYCAECLTDCKKVHDDIMLHLDRDGIRGRYFRFNTPGMSTIGLEEWERIPDIISLTETYMDFPENNERKESVASFIENPTAGWKGYTAGLKEMVVQGAQMRDSERLKNNVTYLYSMGPVPIQESSSISSPTSTSTGINASIVSTDYPLVSLLRVARMFLCVSQSYEPLRSQSSKAYELWLSLEVQMSTFRQKSIMLFAELHEMNGKNAYDALPSAIGNEQAKYLWDSLQEFLQVELSDVIIKFESLLDNIWRLCQNRPTFESIEEVEDQLEGWISKLAIQNSRFTAAISGLSQDPNNRKATNPRFRRSKEISREISIATRKPTSKQTQKRLKSYATVREVSSRLYDSLSQVCFDHATHLAHLRMHPHYTVFGDEEAPYIPFELRLSHSPSLNGKDESCTWLAIKSIIPDSSDVNELQQQHCGLKLGTSNHDWIRNSSSDKACQNRHVHPAASPFRPDKLDFLRHRNFCARLKLYDQNTTENSRKLLGYFGRSNSNEHHVYFSERGPMISSRTWLPCHTSESNLPKS
ncbi:FabD/lysophospholipase-like protein [Acephala macrosclerotiorum]|nr:FabD/lysophospholipase-like protein [Acephala macrosclerotiorum]